MASDKANPKIEYVNSCPLSDGFLAYPMIKAPNTIPIPTPDPATPIVAAPAPINFAASTIYTFLVQLLVDCLLRVFFCFWLKILLWL